MQNRAFAIRIATLFLLTTSLAGGEETTKARYTKKQGRHTGKGKEKVSEHSDDHCAMDMDRDLMHVQPRGTVQIENATRRPFSVVCWNQNQEEEQGPHLDPRDKFIFSFEKHLNLHWDCLVMSTDETAYTSRLRYAVAKTFRAWTNTAYPEVAYGSQASLNTPAIAIGRKCNKCFWLLQDDGIYHTWGDRSKHNLLYSFVFQWDTRGHKRLGDPISYERYKRGVQTDIAPVAHTEMEGGNAPSAGERDSEEQSRVAFREYWRKMRREFEDEQDDEL